MVALEKFSSDRDSDVIESKWCSAHDQLLDEAHRSGAPRFITETLCVHAVLEDHLLCDSGCWACPLTDLRLNQLISKAAVIDAEARQNGGTYTTADFCLQLGSYEPGVSEPYGD